MEVSMAGLEYIGFIRDYLQQEGGVIKDAPLSISVAVVILSSAIGFIEYEFLDRHYGQEAAGLRAAIDQQRSANENLQTKIGLLEIQIQMVKASPVAAQKPDLKISASGGNVFNPDAPDWKNGYTGIGLTTRIWNTGAPSIAIDWSLFVVPKGKTPVRAQLTAIPDALTVGGSNNSSILRKADALDIMTIKNQVQSTVIEGTLLFYVPIPRTIVLDKDTELELSVRDAYGTESKWNQRMGDWLKR
jgi:hypothetical protein